MVAGDRPSRPAICDRQVLGLSVVTRKRHGSTPLRDPLRGLAHRPKGTGSAGQPSESKAGSRVRGRHASRIWWVTLPVAFRTGRRTWCYATGLRLLGCTTSSGVVEGRSRDRHRGKGSAPQRGGRRMPLGGSEHHGPSLRSHAPYGCGSSCTSTTIPACSSPRIWA